MSFHQRFFKSPEWLKFTPKFNQFCSSYNFRYDANSSKKEKKLNAKKKTSKVKLVNKAGENKFNKGRNFGAPKKNPGKPGRNKK